MLLLLLVAVSGCVETTQLKAVQLDPELAYDEIMVPVQVADACENHVIDELLAQSLRPVPLGKAMPTAPYDIAFFEPDNADLPIPVRDHLERARTALANFLTEAQLALETSELTSDQVLHVATIASYIEGLADRLDVIRMPGFMHPVRSRP